MDTRNSTLLVTGATNENGIGLALAQRFHAQGSMVIISGRNVDHLERIRQENPDFGTVYLDVTKPDSIIEARDLLSRSHPRLDALLTTAGIMLPEEVRDPSSIGIAEEIVISNLLGTIRTIRAFLPQLLARPRASIITVASGLGFVPRADVPSYCASKAGVRFYADAIRAQLVDTDVQVMMLAPPAVRTSLMHQEHMKDAMPLAEFADEVMSILIDQPDVEEILVEAVKPLRFAEANGDYRDLMHMLARDVHQ